MNLKEWMNLNPNHRGEVESAPGNRVRVTLYGGEGIDRRIVGEGDDEASAVRHALGNRDAIKAILP